MTQQIDFSELVLNVLKKQLSNDVWQEHVPIIKVDENTYEVYLLNDIQSPELYGKLLKLLNNATEKTQITLFINTPGGYLDTAEMIYSALKKSLARTIAEVSGTTASAGTTITLGCKEIRINPTAVFMIHEPSFSGIGGKSSDTERYMAFHKRWLPTFYNTVYKNLLTTNEMKNALKGEELWFTGAEISERLQKCQ